MAQHPIEVILTRQLAEYLVVPVFLVDPVGDLIFYNESAERILGMRFDETGQMTAAVWSQHFKPSRPDGTAVPQDELPLVISLNTGHPAVGKLGIIGADGVARAIEVAAWPLVGLGDRKLGAVAMFWEIDP